MQINDLRISGLRGIRAKWDTNARFQRRVEVVESGCWLWRGKRTKPIPHRRLPYGIIALPVTCERGLAYRYEAVHRVVYEAVHGPIPAGEWEVAHTCDVPPCVNPAHLVLMTPKQNSEDKVAKGREANGAAIHAARLNLSQALEIREGLAAGGATIKSLAAKYGVQWNSISAIVHGHTYRRAGGPIAGNRRQGAANPASKLTAKQVRRIRRAKTTGASLGVLARRYHVSKHTVQAIIRRLVWKHVK